MKKTILFICLLAVISVFALPVFGSTAYAAPENGMKVKSYILTEYETGEVLKEFNADERRPIASMVKIMTLVLTFNAIEEGRLTFDTKITVSETAAGMGGSQMFLEANDVYTVSDLIKGVTVCSANDAAVALAETISGSIDEFVALMNTYSGNIGLKNTLFCNTTGLPGGEQYSTARDVSILTSKLLKHKEYYKFSTVWMEEYTHPDGRVTELVNTNKLVRFYQGCDAGKTGFTNDAMFCLSASAKRKDMRVIATVLGAETGKDRFKAVSELFNYAFAHYEQSVIVRKGEIIPNEIQVKNGKGDNIEIYAESDLKIFTEKGNKKQIKVNYCIDDGLKAPLYSGSKVGRLFLTDKEGNELASTDIILKTDVEAMGFYDSLVKVLENWSISKR